MENVPVVALTPETVKPLALPFALSVVIAVHVPPRLLPRYESVAALTVALPMLFVEFPAPHCVAGSTHPWGILLELAKHGAA